MLKALFRATFCVALFVLGCAEMRPVKLTAESLPRGTRNQACTIWNPGWKYPDLLYVGIVEDGRPTIFTPGAWEGPNKEGRQKSFLELAELLPGKLGEQGWRYICHTTLMGQ